MNRKIIFYESYFTNFYFKQSQKVQKKVDFVLDMVMKLDRVPTKFLDHMSGTDGLYELRIKAESNIFRIFCFFDQGNLVVLLNGFQKKTQKTPKQELELALRLKKEYFDKKKSI